MHFGNGKTISATPRRNKEQILVVLEDGDHMVYAGSRGKLADHPKRHIHESILKIVSLAFWDTHLKKDAAAQSWLKENIASYLGNEAEITTSP